MTLVKKYDSRSSLDAFLLTSDFGCCDQVMSMSLMAEQACCNGLKTASTAAGLFPDQSFSQMNDLVLHDSLHRLQSVVALESRDFDGSFFVTECLKQ